MFNDQTRRFIDSWSSNTKAYKSPVLDTLSELQTTQTTDVQLPLPSGVCIKIQLQCEKLKGHSPIRIKFKRIKLGIQGIRLSLIMYFISVFWLC